MRSFLKVSLGLTLLSTCFVMTPVEAYGCDAGDSSCSGNDFNRFDISVSNDANSDYSVSVSESYEVAGTGPGHGGGYGPMSQAPAQAPTGPGPTPGEDDADPGPITRPDGDFVVFNPATTGQQPNTGPGTGPGVDPVTVARRAIAALTLDEPGILLDPDPATNEWAATAVGFNTWFHAPDPGVRQVTVTQDGLTVEITATPGVLRVDTGDRQHQTCRHTVPYQNPTGVDAPSPYCGHAWDTPGEYTVTATRTWNITWTAAAHTGTDTTTRPAGTRHVTVIELSSLLTNPNR